MTSESMDVSATAEGFEGLDVDAILEAVEMDLSAILEAVEGAIDWGALARVGEDIDWEALSQVGTI